MICDKCKFNEAKLKYNQNINGQEKEYNLCYSCFEKISHNITFESMFKDFFESFLSCEISNNIENEYKCEFCGNTFKNFKNTGKMGCQNCYTIFKDELTPFLKNIQLSNEHIGKFPTKLDRNFRIKKEVSILREKLNNAVKNEEYELAAKLRDEIRDIEGGN